MNFLFILLILISTYLIEASVRDLSGSYDFENCSCTVLRCLEPYLYRLNQTQNGDFIINLFFNIPAARGKTTSIGNGQQTQLFMQWLPGMDFDTNCTGLWMPKTRSIDLKCGDQYRYCTAQLKCRDNGESCAKNSSFSLNACWKVIMGLIFLLLIKKINYSFLILL
jgi:hypothetical protein